MRHPPRAVELLVVFVALPIAFRLGWLPLPKIVALLAVSAASAALLYRDPRFDRRAALGVGGLRPALPGIALRAGLAAAVVAAVVLVRAPEAFLEFPRHRPAPWAVVALLYPWLSALPQEVLYRAFFFHRYQPLLGARGVVVASAVAFALLHVVYADPITVALTLPAGWVLSSAYRRTGSLAAVSVEHALYGLAVFTLGLGRAFFVAA